MTPRCSRPTACSTPPLTGRCATASSRPRSKSPPPSSSTSHVSRCPRSRPGRYSPAPVGTSADGPTYPSCWSASTSPADRRSLVTVWPVTCRCITRSMKRRRPCRTGFLATSPAHPGQPPRGPIQPAPVPRSGGGMAYDMVAYRPHPNCQSGCHHVRRECAATHRQSARGTARNRRLDGHGGGGRRQPSAAQPQ